MATAPRRSNCCEVCPNCKPIDLGLMERLNQARHFGQGIAMHGSGCLPPTIWRCSVRQGVIRWPSERDGEQNATRPFARHAVSAAFGHIVGGYAAGYYGYMWSEVLALDMASAFRQQPDEPGNRRALSAHVRPEPAGERIPWKTVAFSMILSFGPAGPAKWKSWLRSPEQRQARSNPPPA